MTHNYSMHLVWSHEDAAFIACVPELPGCKADGQTPAEAIIALEAVVEEWLATAKEQKRDIPKPLSIEDYEVAAAKFRETVKTHIQREVEKAVLNVLRDIPAMAGGPKDPAAFWKDC